MILITKIAYQNHFFKKGQSGTHTLFLFFKTATLNSFIKIENKKCDIVDFNAPQKPFGKNGYDYQGGFCRTAFDQ